VKANLHQFTATGAWILIFAVLVFVFPDTRNAQFVFACWIGSSVCGLFFVPLLGFKGHFRAMRAKLRFPAVSASVLPAVVPFAAAMLMMLSNSLDRLVLRVIDQPAALNTIFFFVGILQIVGIVVDVIVYQRVYPRLVRLARSRNARRRALWIVVRTATLVATAAALALGIVALLLARHHASLTPGNYPLFVALLCVAFVLDALVAQLVNAAFAFGHDALVLKASFADFLMTAALAFVLLPPFGALGACLLWMARGLTRLIWYAAALFLTLRKGGGAAPVLTTSDQRAV
jgi:hypothetical protein